MVITEKLLVEWNGSQKSYYEEKGYRFTKFGDKFEVRFEDIPHSSDKFIDVQCDYCGKIFSMQVKNIIEVRQLFPRWHVVIVRL